jgi:hypothetical protein
MSVHKHDEAPRNFRTCNYIRESWIMFLAFLLDYQNQDFIQAAVAPFGRLIRWFEGPNKSRVIARCLILSPDRVPRSLVVSQGTMLGGAGRSWTVPVFILNGNFPDGFPQDEDRCQWMVTRTQLMGMFSLVISLGLRDGSMISMELVTMSMQILD